MKSKLLARLEDPARSGTYRAARTDEILDALRGAGFDIARVDLAGAPDKDALLARFAAALAFPRWFGGNWDALEDCLKDLGWRAQDRRVVLIGGFEALRTHHPEDFDVLLDILGSAALYWRERERPFFAVFIDPAHVMALPDLFRPKST